MSKKANPAAIGLFVVIALAVAAVAIAVLGSGKFFRETVQFVTYFEGSLSGLDVGAPVEYRGIRVGSVTGIHLDYNSDSGSIESPVTIELEKERMTYSGGEGATKGIAYHVERGLRAQLQSQSFVTGKLKVMLVDRPDTPAVRRAGAGEKRTEIPTIPTMVESLQKTIEELPVVAIVSNVNATLQDVASFVRSGDMQGTMSNINMTVARLTLFTSNLNESIPPLLDSAKKNSDQFLQTQKDAAGAIEELQNLVRSSTPVRYQAVMAMDRIAQAADSLRNLLDYLQQHPESLLTGKTPQTTE